MGAVPLASAMPGFEDTADLWNRNRNRDRRLSDPFEPCWRYRLERIFEFCLIQQESGVEVYTIESRGGASQPGQPEEESWIESENGNEDSAGEKSGEASPSSVALVEWGTRSGPNRTHAKLDPTFLSTQKHKSSPDLV